MDKPHRHPPSYMLRHNLKQIASDAAALLQLIDENAELEDWVDDKASQAKLHLQEIRNYLENRNPAEHDALMAAAKALREAAEALSG